MFDIGKTYRREDLHSQYSGQEQGGISTPRAHPFIMLFSGETGEQYGYKDEFKPDGTYWYTGEGQVGDMEFVRGNRAIRDSNQNGKPLHLFEYIEPGEVRYVCEMSYLDHHFSIGPDRNGDERRIIIFELAYEHEVENQLTSRVSPGRLSERGLYSKSLEELLDIATTQTAKDASPQLRKVNVYHRSQAVKVYVLKRANGICEGCGEQAPFINQVGRPYLETHHIFRLSDNGPDDPKNVAALCPNCHKRAHYSEDFENFNLYVSGRIIDIKQVTS